MERYTLKDLYDTKDNFKNALDNAVMGKGLMYGATYASYMNPVHELIANAIYYYFYDSYVNYEEEDITKTRNIFLDRLSYDVAVKWPYWRTKYNYIDKLMKETEDKINLMQTSRMLSSSKERVDNAGGVLQKTASTPTGVSTNPVKDEIDITTNVGESTGEDTIEQTNVTEVETKGFVDKYTNYQGKTATSSKTSGERSGDVLREGSIDELLNVLEKLPSSFTDEILREVSKHFEIVFSY